MVDFGSPPFWGHPQVAAAAAVPDSQAALDECLGGNSGGSVEPIKEVTDLSPKAVGLWPQQKWSKMVGDL